MISQLAVNLDSFDAHKIDNELLFMEYLGMGLSSLFRTARNLMHKHQCLPITILPTQCVREAVCRVVDDTAEDFYWNQYTGQQQLTCFQFKEKIRESIIHHIRLLYVDLWNLAVHCRIPVERMSNLNRLPNGVFLDVTAA